MYLYATLHTPVGKFYGALNSVSVSEEDLIQIRDEIQTKINILTTLTLFTFALNGVVTMQTTLNENVLRNSVIEFGLGKLS